MKLPVKLSIIHISPVDIDTTGLLLDVSRVLTLDPKDVIELDKEDILLELVDILLFKELILLALLKTLVLKDELSSEH